MPRLGVRITLAGVLALSGARQAAVLAAPDDDVKALAKLKPTPAEAPLAIRFSLSKPGDNDEKTLELKFKTGFVEDAPVALPMTGNMIRAARRTSPSLYGDAGFLVITVESHDVPLAEALEQYLGKPDKGVIKELGRVADFVAQNSAEITLKPAAPRVCAQLKALGGLWTQYGIRYKGQIGNATSSVSEAFFSVNGLLVKIHCQELPGGVQIFSEALEALRVRKGGAAATADETTVFSFPDNSVRTEENIAVFLPKELAALRVYARDRYQPGEIAVWELGGVNAKTAEPRAKAVLRQDPYRELVSLAHEVELLADEMKKKGALVLESTPVRNSRIVGHQIEWEERVDEVPRTSLRVVFRVPGQKPPLNNWSLTFVANDPDARDLVRSSFRKSLSVLHGWTLEAR